MARPHLVTVLAKRELSGESHRRGVGRESSASPRIPAGKRKEGW